MTLQTQINDIIAKRKERIGEIRERLDFWRRQEKDIEDLSEKCRIAGEQTPSLKSLVDNVRMFHAEAVQQIAGYRNLLERFNRDDICIGIGGAARVGKSTFLQAVTGLGNEQIPTSDLSFTTAGRSLIVHDKNPRAIANMHTEASFLRDVVYPMLEEAKLSGERPRDLAAFCRMDLSTPDEKQERNDILVRLKDTQAALPDIIRPELTGEQNRRIEIDAVHDYVAYPQGGSKAGKFMAVKDITIFAPFPQNEISQLRVVDLPGLGEAGRNLARVQTTGLADICDITLLMKRPISGNAEWIDSDTKALDAIADSMKLLDDKTLYTVILLNHEPGDPKDAERTVKCGESIRKHMNNRNFRIIKCNAADSAAVRGETLPEILRFLSENLPQIDRKIWENVRETDRAAQENFVRSIRKLKEMLEPILARDTENPLTFAEGIQSVLLTELNAYANELGRAAAKPDQEWAEQIAKVTERVGKWVDNGCGYGSPEQLCEEIRKDILKLKGQPANVINALRIEFRKQWDVIDDHLAGRIGGVLCEVMDRIRKCTNSFVPEREGEGLAAVREQLRKTVEKIRNAPKTHPGDRVVLNRLAEPLQRLSEFDIRFRFHLEPQLLSATKVLVSNELPHVKDEEDAQDFRNCIIEQLRAKINEYSQTMSGSRENDKARKKINDLISEAIKDQATRKQVLELVSKNLASSMSFSPNRIFYAIIENSTDAFLRFKESSRAFLVLAENYPNELRPEPDMEIRCARDVNMAADTLLLEFERSR